MVVVPPELSLLTPPLGTPLLPLVVPVAVVPLVSVELEPRWCFDFFVWPELCVAVPSLELIEPEEELAGGFEYWSLPVAVEPDCPAWFCSEVVLPMEPGDWFPELPCE